MNSLRFAHRFFQFHHQDWISYWGCSNPQIEDIKVLFLEEPFPRRQLVHSSDLSYPRAKEEFFRTLEKENIRGMRIVTPLCKNFPTQVTKNISPEKLPPILYLLGADLPMEEECISIVGTRNPTELGRHCAESFAAYFSLLKIRIVSGLARGVDTIAHQENIYNGTVSVLGGGICDIYPRENSALAESIVSNGGTLVSEFPTDQITFPRNFPKRNESIAALSAGTIVIEGKESSGAFVTGRLALSMGKNTVVLTQDFRSPQGRAAIQLMYDGAQAVCSEEEALHYIFSRYGGYSRSSIQSGKSRIPHLN
jgi:DNA processing protein